MKIIHVNSVFPPDWLGGSAVYCHDLAKALSARGHEISVFTGGADPLKGGEGVERGRFSGIEVVRVDSRRDRFSHRLFPFLRAWNPRVGRLFSGYLREKKPDLIHLHTPVFLGGALVSAARELGIRMLATLHDGWWICRAVHFSRSPDGALCAPAGCLKCLSCGADSAGSGGWGLRRARNLFSAPPSDWYLRKQLAKIDLLAAPSAFLADRYLARGVGRDKIVVLPHGIETGRLKSCVKTGSAAVRFGFLGGTERHKGFAVLMAAVGRLRPAEPFRLDIWGASGQDAAAEAAAVNPRCELRFHGAFAREDIGRVFSDMDVLLFPSVAAESFGLAVCEAFASGTPVLASRAGGVPELVSHGVNGLLCEPGDSEELAARMQELLDSPQRIRGLAGGIGAVKTMATHVDEVEALYRRLVPGAAGGAAED